MSTPKTIITTITLAGIATTLPALSQTLNTPTQASTARVVKPVPKELLKNLSISFDKNGHPVFHFRKNKASVSCPSAPKQASKENSARQPSCSVTSPQKAQPNTKVENSAPTQLGDTVCYTIEWEQDGVTYSYTFCYDTTQ